MSQRGGRRGWREAVGDPDAPRDMGSICATIDSLLDEAMDGSSELRFPAIDPARCSREHLACALRTCARLRIDRASWDRALMACIDAHALAGLDSRLALDELLRLAAG